MLSREDNRRLAELERQLRRDDPEFCARMTGVPDKPAPSRVPTLSMIFTAAVIWAVAIVLGVLGWWVAAVIAAVCATIVVSTLTFHLVRRRSGG